MLAFYIRSARNINHNTHLEVMFESVGWFRVGTAELYVWKSWLNRLDGSELVHLGYMYGNHG